MKSSIFALALVLMTTPVWAQNVKIYVVQKDGGVVQRPGNVSPQEAALILGEKAPPKGATGLVIEDRQNPRWTTLSPKDVNEQYGGDGEPVTEVFPATDDPKKPIEVFPKDGDGEGKKPIEVFPETGDRIIPNSGQWFGSVVSQSVEGCPQGADKMIAKQIGALDGALVQGTIDASFTPEKMYPDVKWTRIGPNGWKSDLKVGSNGVGTRLQRRLVIRSPDHINFVQRVNMAALGHCQMDIEVNFLRKGG